MTQQQKGGGQRRRRAAVQCGLGGGGGGAPSSGQDTHLGATVDGLSEPDVLHALGAPEPVLLGDALGLGVDASLAGVEVAEDLDGVVVAALVGVDPVESCKGKEKWFVRAEGRGRGLTMDGSGAAELTAGPLGVGELDVAAGAGGVLPGSLGGEQVLDLGVEGLDGRVHLVVLGSQGRLVGSVLIVSRDVVAATSRAGRSGQTRRSGGTLIGEITHCHTLWLLWKESRQNSLSLVDVLTPGPTYPGDPRAPGAPMVP